MSQKVYLTCIFLHQASEMNWKIKYIHINIYTYIKNENFIFREQEWGEGKGRLQNNRCESDREKPAQTEAGEKVLGKPSSKWNW